MCVQGKLPLSGLSITKPDIDPDTSKDCFEISGDPKIFPSLHLTHIRYIMIVGPLIETITCHFKTRVECTDWHEKIAGQIRSSRQSAVLPSKLSVQPVPPPHVSYDPTPPYVGLTTWIRDLLASHQLTFKHIKSLQKPVRVVSHVSSGHVPRYHKVECVIYPSNDQLDTLYKSDPVVLKDPKPISVDSNPFGFIHYIPTNSENSEVIENNIGQY